MDKTFCGCLAASLVLVALVLAGANKLSQYSVGQELARQQALLEQRPPMQVSIVEE